MVAGAEEAGSQLPGLGGRTFWIAAHRALTSATAHAVLVPML
jgi:hypothetical protein